MEQEEPQEHPINRMVERPDIEALRESYKQPSRLRLRMERVLGGLANRTLWTVILALGIIAVLVFGYLRLT